MSKSNKIITFVKDYALPQLKKYLKEEPIEDDNNANNELGGIEQLLELAQKQEKLLGLYKELEHIRLESYVKYEPNEVIRLVKLARKIKQQIKEIENV